MIRFVVNLLSTLLNCFKDLNLVESVKGITNPWFIRQSFIKMIFELLRI